MPPCWMKAPTCVRCRVCTEFFGTPYRAVRKSASGATSYDTLLLPSPNFWQLAPIKFGLGIHLHLQRRCKCHQTAEAGEVDLFLPVCVARPLQPFCGGLAHRTARIQRPGSSADHGILYTPKHSTP